MSFPIELKELKNWVCWRLVPDKDGGKPRKIPINPVTGKSAASNNPDSWSDYETAVEALELYGYTGLGFMFTKESGVVGVDIDHCYDPETKTFNEVAKAILGKQPTYAEYSPSGDGCHLWFKGVKPKGTSKNTETGVEMYDSVRYFTVTEKPIEGSLDYLAEGTDTLKWVYDNYLAKKKTEKKKKKKTTMSSDLSDDEVIEKASASSEGELFKKLWSGEWNDTYPSQSEADMALCMKLAFWTGKKAEQMDRLFRSSGLFRKKWDDKHHADGSTYGEETINKAIENTENVYSAGAENPIIEMDGKYFRVKGDNIYPITNFVFKPVEMIVSEEETQLTVLLENVRGERQRVTFLTTDFANHQKFKNLLNKNSIAFSYMGSDGDLELLKSYLAELNWKVKTGVKAMGIYEHEGRMVYVTTDCAIENNGTCVDNIVQLDKHSSITSELIFTDMLDKEKLPSIGKLLMSYNEPAKVVSILAWVAGSFLKVHLRKNGVKYPILFLIGEAGSGKSTTMERVILSIFGGPKTLAATQVTAFTLMKESASSNIIPLAIDEFKPSKIDKIKLHTLYNHFRDSYDCHFGIRGRADQSVVTYELLAPLVVAGEESPDETAVRERSIELLFSKKDLKNIESRRAFNKITSSEYDLASFGRLLLNTALNTDATTVGEWYKEGINKFNSELPTRIISNLSCCYVGLNLIKKICENYRVSWDTVFPYDFVSCVNFLEHGAREYILDGGTHNQSIVEQTFEVISRMKLDPKVDYVIEGDYLYMRLNYVYDLYTKYRKDYAVVGEVLPYAQFKKQLMHSDLFLKSNVQKRIGNENRKVWIIDYALLKERCDVSGFDYTGIAPI